MLFPQENTYRELKTLDGIWSFCLDEKDSGIKQGWYSGVRENCIPIAVPASFNDQTQEQKIRDYTGTYWYYTRFFVPQSWESRFVWLWFGAVHYSAKVWVNGKLVITNKGGSLPFWAEVSGKLKFGQENLIAVMGNNELSSESIPPGRVIIEDGVKKLSQHFDFFNYAGIHRPVKLFTTSKKFIEDITIKTDISGSAGIVNYEFLLKNNKGLKVNLKILDKKGQPVFIKTNISTKGAVRIENCKFWSPKNPYLYKFCLTVNDRQTTIDEYCLNIGVRTVKVSGNKLLLNGKPVYLTGCAKHEDFHIIGRGLNNALMVKDFNLLKWSNSNSFRTSHYPYADEIMDMADKLGFLVIDETPAVGMNEWGSDPVFDKILFNNKMLATHLTMLKELYRRDKNHPSVIIWSVTNEPEAEDKRARAYFKKVSAVMRQLDSTRPITAVVTSKPAYDNISQFFDIVSLNKYFGWYVLPGDLNKKTENALSAELDKYYNRFKKPIILTEFGADTVAGMHSDPPMMFSEEYQQEYYKLHGRVLDTKKYVIGEQVWNFADFMTKQETRRVMGNRKGIFTRDRQPKMAAHFLKQRWMKKI
ncbi:MAG: beta-glucuronidase [Elusimicrobia bacterium RIFOXYA2_FULL_39_19]|nr:MAG: beta-glucuronidase [Elusimicrobia bacterium RIFOXYA2_FULL_39_19]